MPIFKSQSNQSEQNLTTHKEKFNDNATKNYMGFAYRFQRQDKSSLKATSLACEKKTLNMICNILCLKHIFVIQGSMGLGV